MSPEADNFNYMLGLIDLIDKTAKSAVKLFRALRDLLVKGILN